MKGVALSGGTGAYVADSPEPMQPGPEQVPRQPGVKCAVMEETFVAFMLPTFSV